MCNTFAEYRVPNMCIIYVNMHIIYILDIKIYVNMHIVYISDTRYSAKVLHISGTYWVHIRYPIYCFSTSGEKYVTLIINCRSSNRRLSTADR